MSTSITRLSRLRSAWAVQVRVIYALMIRELVTRFGRDNIGFLWIMVEPLLFAGLVAIIWVYMKGPTEHGVSIAAFVITGYIPITLFRHGVSRAVAVFSVNSALLYHRQVKIVDFIITRFVIEFIGGTMAFVFVSTILIYFELFPVPNDIGLAIAGWLLYSLFCFSLTIVIAPLSEVSDVLEKLIPVLTYIMIPFSGLFTLVDWLTPGLQEAIVWSPFITGMEMIRKGIWGDQIQAYYYPSYVIGVSFVLIALGLAMCRRARRTLTVE